MLHEPKISPARHALNPILLDTPVIEADSTRASVFFTPLSATIEQQLPGIIAVSSGVLLAAAFGATQLGAPGALIGLLTLATFAVAAIPALTSAWDSLSKAQIDIDFLMLLGAGLAAVIGNPLEGALLLFLFALSGAMEEFAVRRTQSAIVALHNLAPKEAILLTPTGPQPVSLRRVAVADHILVRPGDRVPLDGTIVEGSSALDESAITGESVPCDKTVGDPVFAGTTNTQGRLVVEVSKMYTDTTLARIVKLVTEARHKRATAQRLIDRIGPTYSAIVVVATVLVGLGLHFIANVPGKEATYRAIAMLIVCSPCALIIATPVAYVASIGAAARRGVLVKGGVYLETLARIRAVVFDKTGTLTTGQVRLADLITHESITADEALRLAGALASSSTHPLAGAVTRRLAEKNLDPYTPRELQAVPGEGVSASVDAKRVWLGRPKAAHDRINPAYRQGFDGKVEAIYATGRAASTLVIDGVPNILVYEDTLRPEAGPTLDALRRLGIERIEMFTGDHELVARAIAEKLHTDGYQAEMMPEDKLTVAEELRRRLGAIAMVGDGVNDAPALARVDVGIAVGAIGADVALDAADVVLMSNDLNGITWLFAQAKKTVRIVRQNLTLAIGVIVLLSVFAVAGQIPLPLAVIGHEGSTLVVAANTLRLLRTSNR